MDFSYWISPCPQDSIKYMDYPSAEVAQTFNTPTWAYVNTTSSGRFDKDEAIEGMFFSSFSHFLLTKLA